MDNQYDIAFDISFLPSTGGFGTHTAQSLRYFIEYDARRNYLLLENEIPPVTSQYQNRDENWDSRWQELPSNWHFDKTSRHSRVLWMLYDLPKKLKKYRPKIFHSLDNVTVPARMDFCQTVLILHDMIPISHPQYCRWRDAFICRWLFGRAIKNSTKIFTVSNYSAEQIVKYYPNAESKLSVIQDGVDHERFYPIEDRERTAEALAQKYGFYSQEFFLIVTTLSPRRNLTRFVKAYAEHIKRMQDQDTCLVIAGCRGWKDHDVFAVLRDLGLEKRVHFLDYVPDREIVHLFQSALALAQPSLLEGFGLVLLEAMACGTPVLCSSTTALGEVAGDAARKFDPMNELSISQAITDLCKDSSIRKDLSERGIEHAKKFHWGQTTKRVIDLFDSMLD